MMNPDPSLRDHLASLCILKLQQASAGRTHSLLRQVQLTCMLHRMRRQTLLQATPSSASADSSYQDEILINAFPFSASFTQSAFAFDNENFAQDHGPSDFQWDLDPLDSTLASSLSLDFLLTIGVSQNAAEERNDSSSSTTSATSMIDSDPQGLFNLGHLATMPFEHFSEDYCQGLAVATVADNSCNSSSSSSSSPSSPSPSSFSSTSSIVSQCNIGLDVAAALLPAASSTASPPSLNPLNPESSHTAINSPPTSQPSYYELLMATASNEPLSQLLSTDATSISSPTLIVASNSEDSISNTPVSSRVYVNDKSANNSSTAYILTAYPLPTESLQRTAPPTTREIMNALSGQVPLQTISAIVTTTVTSQSMAPSVSVEPLAVPHSQERLSISSLKVEPNLQTPATIILPTNEEIPGLEQNNQMPSEDNMKSPATQDDLEDEGRAMDLDLDLNFSLDGMTLRSPTVPPRKRRAVTPKRVSGLDSKSHLKRQNEQQRGSTLGATFTNRPPSSGTRRGRSCTVSCSSKTDDIPPELTQRYKRRRSSEDSSSDSGSESAPSSPKTPPSNHDSPDHSLGPHQTKARLVELDSTLSLIHNRTSNVVSTAVHSQLKETPNKYHLAAMAIEVEGVMNLNHMEDDGGEAGILSTSLYTRYPTTRQSTRLLNRLSRSQSSHHGSSSKV